MNRYTAMFMATVAAALLIIASAEAQKNSGAEAALEAAKQKEIQKGDLNGAIKQYGEIADKYAKTDRAVAAMALVRMAEAYGRLDDAESLKVYERIVREYSDQKDAVTLAQTRLGGGGQSTGAVSRTVWKFSHSPGGLHWGTLSPDGRFFSHSSNGTGDIYIHDIAAGVDRNITNKPEGSKGVACESTISPDGKTIAYIWSSADGYTLHVANLTGTPRPRTLYANPEIYDLFLHGWSPDGKSLAVVQSNVDKATVQIALISVSDGSLRVLKTLDWHRLDETQLSPIGVMQFSPDGKYLGYDRPKNDTTKGADIYVLAVDGSSETPAVVHAGSSDRMIGWSHPDGKWLLFTSDRDGRTTDLFGIAVTGVKPQGQPQLLKGNIDASFRPIGWNSSGGLYYETRHVSFGSSKLELASFDVRSGEYSSVPLSTRGYQENTGASSSWSPDGGSLAYLSTTPQDRNSKEGPLLMIRAMDTGKTLELKPRELDVSLLSNWAPDGRSLFVIGGDPSAGSRGIYRVDVETGDTSRAALFPPQPDFFGTVALLPGGLSFFTRRYINAPVAGIYRVDPTGNSSAVVLDEPSFRADSPTLSADGKRLYYAKRATAPAREGVVGTDAFIERDLATGKERELIRRPSLGQIHPSPDGQYIATSGTDTTSNSRVVLLIPITGGEVRDLMRVPSEVKAEELNNRNQGQWVELPDGCWTPDSHSLLVRKNPSDRTKPTELWFVPLIGGGPKRVDDGGIPARTGVSVSPDGRHFVYSVTEPALPATSEVSVLENFLPKTTPASKK